MKNNFKKRYLKKHKLGPFAQYCFSIDVPLIKDKEAYDKLWDSIIDAAIDINCSCYGWLIVSDDLKISNESYQLFNEKINNINESFNCCVKVSPIYDINYYDYDFIDNNLHFDPHLTPKQLSIYQNYLEKSMN